MRPLTGADPTAAEGWTVVIPLKRIPRAKSRLRPATTGPEEHARLIRAIRADTIAAAAQVARVVLVYDEAEGSADDEPDVAVSLVQSRGGLNGALAEAAAEIATRWPADAVAALVGDLPALTGSELADALRAARDWPRAFVPDHAGTGTTLLTALPGTALAPAFGPGSAARHGAIAHRLIAAPGLRLDVDTQDDLRVALEHGVGAHTRRALE